MDAEPTKRMTNPPSLGGGEVLFSPLRQLGKILSRGSRSNQVGWNFVATPWSRQRTTKDNSDTFLLFGEGGRKEGRESCLASSGVIEH